MKQLADTLRDLADRVDAVVDELFAADASAAVSDDGLLEALTLAGRLERRAESLLIDLAGEVAARSGSPDRDARLTSRAGCHDVCELLQRTTRVAPQTAEKWQRAARVIRGQISPSSSEVLPPFLPALRAAMIAGEVGADGVLAVSMPLSTLDRRVARAELLVADQDPGRRGARNRTGCRASGLRGPPPHPGSGLVGGPRPGRRGTGGSRRGPSARSDARGIARRARAPAARPPPAANCPPSEVRLPPSWSPSARPTCATAAARRTRGAHRRAAVPCRRPPYRLLRKHPAHQARRTWMHHAARHGERVFNRYQRRGIALRDGGCIIPGCGVPAGWCEIHHVTEHAHGGPTHTDNGVLLCWFHHRFLERSGWGIRMNRGVPEVRAPGWHDAHRRWRPVTRSRTRLLDLIGRRT